MIIFLITIILCCAFLYKIDKELNNEFFRLWSLKTDYDKKSLKFKKSEIFGNLI